MVRAKSGRSGPAPAGPTPARRPRCGLEIQAQQRPRDWRNDDLSSAGSDVSGDPEILNVDQDRLDDMGWDRRPDWLADDRS